MSTQNTQAPCLSLGAATLINLNMMLGSGIFANTVLLGSILKGSAPFAYIFLGVAILPLIYAFQKLLGHFSQATFYDLGATISPFVGFLSGWSYFFAKLASCSFSIHFFVTLMQTLIPSLAIFPTIAIDMVILSLFMYLNSFNLGIGRNIQYLFFFLKSLPILFVILSLIFTFSLTYITPANFSWMNIPAAIPFVLFAMTGFEASCSLSASIKDSQRNGPRAIIYSFAIVLCVLFLYQVSFFIAFGPELGNIDGYKQAFPALVNLLHFSPIVSTICKAITMSGIAVSALGASYGILYSNNWNMYGLAQRGYVFGSSWLTKKNKHGIPFFCMLIQGSFIAFYALVLHNTQTLLQQMSACGITMAYTISTCAFIVLIYRKHVTSMVWGLLALGSCSMLILTLIKNAFAFGPLSYIVFSAFVIFGVAMYGIRRPGTLK
ncbi:MAG: hypothetical protein UU47_C0018G0006 [candidate division TM6 bacterium GW2011_GWE2_41_16]|nr:MAG: hypothetical protein UU47_C0018G0006 [candidate division TM6 bacterium GW2011_GWE2_41_16]